MMGFLKIIVIAFIVIIILFLTSSYLLKKSKIINNGFEEGYYKSLIGIYYGHSECSGHAFFNCSLKYQKLNGVDISSFRIIPHDEVASFGLDKRSVYYEAKRIEGADPEFFRQLSSSGYTPIGSDQNNVFYKTDKIEGADPKTFHKIGFGLAADKNYVYSSHTYFRDNSSHANDQMRKIPGIDGSSFVFLGDGFGFSKDKNHVYYNMLLIQEADHKTFSVIKSGYYRTATRYDFGKDIKNVYCRGYMIPGADPNSFEATDKYLVGRDKNNLYGCTGSTNSPFKITPLNTN